MDLYFDFDPDVACEPIHLFYSEDDAQSWGYHVFKDALDRTIRATSFFKDRENGDELCKLSDMKYKGVSNKPIRTVLREELARERGRRYIRNPPPDFMHHQRKMLTRRGRSTEDYDTNHRVIRTSIPGPANNASNKVTQHCRIKKIKLSKEDIGLVTGALVSVIEDAMVLASFSESMAHVDNEGMNELMEYLVDFTVQRGKR